MTNVGKIRATAEIEGQRVYFTALQADSDVMGVIANTNIYLSNLTDMGTTNSGGTAGSPLQIPYWHEIVTP